MIAKQGYVLVSLGTLLTFVALLRTVVAYESTAVLLWGGTSLLGVFAIGIGAEMVLDAAGRATPNPEGALGLTDSRVRRR